MIDEYFERFIDWLCVSIPAFFKPRFTVMAGSGLGWRIHLYVGTALRWLKNTARHIKNEENMDLFMRETAERGDDSIEKLKNWFTDSFLVLARLEESGLRVRFCAMLFMLLLSALGVASAGGRNMAVMAASLGVMWISTAIEIDYQPLSAGVRQKYLVSSVTRVLAVSLMLISFLDSYISQGVPSNVVLQCAMIAALVVHGVIFMAFVAFNTRQSFFLRILAGVLGTVPALTLSAAIAVMASCLFRPWPLPLSGIASGLGALLVFMGEQLIDMTNLGGIRLKYYSVWVCLFEIGGYALMLLGSWTYILI